MDYDAYVELQRRYPRTIGNDYLLPADLRRRFIDGVITVFSDNHALYLFERRNGFTKLHFRLIDKSAPLAPRKETLAAFLTYRDNSIPENAAEWLLGQGFIKTKNLQRHTAPKITGDASLDCIEYASPDETYAMLGEYFSAVESDMPCRELFGSALCVRSHEGELIGVLYMGQTSVTAVSPKARGQGTGRKLYRAYAAIKARDGKKTAFHEWINPDNAASLAMFRSLGFAADNVFTDCYVKEGRF